MPTNYLNNFFNITFFNFSFFNIYKYLNNHQHCQTYWNALFSPHNFCEKIYEFKCKYLVLWLLIDDNTNLKGFPKYFNENKLPNPKHSLYVFETIGYIMWHKQQIVPKV